MAGLAASLAGAALAAPAPIRVIDAWTRPAVRGFSGVGYMTLVNSGDRVDSLIGAWSPAAASVSLHVSRETDHVSTMRPVSSLTVPAHGRVALAPGGYHLMFMGLRCDFAAGERVPVTLTFRRAGRVRVLMTVAAGLGSAPDMKM